MPQAAAAVVYSDSCIQQILGLVKIQQKNTLYITSAVCIELCRSQLAALAAKNEN